MKFFMILFLLLWYMAPVFAQSDTSGMVVFRYHSELDDPENDHFDTLYFNRQAYLYIHKRNRPVYTNSQGMTVRTPQRNDRYYFPANLSKRVSLKQNFRKKRIEYKEDDLPQPDWELLKVFQEVNGYRAQEARATVMPFAHHSYRKFIAYFTTDIPIRVGPEASYGLPGLVLKYTAKPTYGHVWTVEKIIFEPAILSLDPNCTQLID